MKKSWLAIGGLVIVAWCVVHVLDLIALANWLAFWGVVILVNIFGYILVFGAFLTIVIVVGGLIAVARRALS